MKRVLIAILPFLLGMGPIGIYSPGTYDGTGQVIDCAGYNQCIYVYGADNVIVRGYEVKNAAQFCVQVEKSKNVTLDGLNIHDCGEAGSFVYGGSDGSRVINSTFTNTGRFGARFATSQNVSAINNTVRNLKRFTDSRGIDFELVDGGEAIQNIVSDIGDGYTDSSGIETFDCSNFTAVGNYLYNMRSGVESKAGTRDISNHLYLRNRIYNVLYGIEYGAYPPDAPYMATGKIEELNAIYIRR